ncbi:MAG: class I SAM-dependent methyltransferase [Candidatus Omnitrophica bacterium]|nr:class I SAM-dependent methyltransferase [Candidatus Omnitrophota bacterium]
MDKEISENYEKYLQRINLFKGFGYDIAKERDLILEKSLPLNDRILEVGTGKGHFAIALAQNGYHFTSVDISQEEQKYAKMNVEYLGFQENVDFRIADAQKLDFKDQSFDAIFAVNMVHHLSDPYKVMDEFARVIAPKGKIIVSDFSKSGLDLVDKIHRSEGREHPTGKSAMDDIRNYFNGRNFKTQAYKTVFQETVFAYPLNAEKI